MPVTIDRETRLEETLVEIAKLAEQCRKDADLDQCHAHAEWFRRISILANEAAGASTTSFVKEPETVGDEKLRRKLVLILTKKFNPAECEDFDEFANDVVSAADAIIARMKR